MSDAPNAITKTYDLLKWLMPAVSKYPRDKRYTLGSRIEDKLLAILELLIIIEPIFDTSLIYDTYACRKNKGSHRAVNRFTMYCRKNKYALECNIKSYFASIDHDVLLEMIKKKIKDPDALWLIKLIIDSTPSPGIPIGNLASQMFANLCLNELENRNNNIGFRLARTYLCRILHLQRDAERAIISPGSRREVGIPIEIPK